MDVIQAAIKREEKQRRNSQSNFVLQSKSVPTQKKSAPTQQTAAAQST
jgi:hypothetical protein